MIIYENKLTVKAYNELRRLVGWSEIEEGLAKKWIEQSDCVITAIEENKKVMGCARLNQLDQHCAIIFDVIVHPEYQRHSIGTMLLYELQHYIEQRLEYGEEMYLTLITSQKSKLFYEAAGFQVTTSNNQGIHMRKRIQVQRQV